MAGKLELEHGIITESAIQSPDLLVWQLVNWPGHITKKDQSFL
jgi:hypothetical protein